MVITRRTRNAFAVDSGTWVRIPPTPPWNHSLAHIVQDFFIAESRQKAQHRKNPYDKPFALPLSGAYHKTRFCLGESSAGQGLVVRLPKCTY